MPLICSGSSVAPFTAGGPRHHVVRMLRWHEQERSRCEMIRRMLMGMVALPSFAAAHALVQPTNPPASPSPIKAQPGGEQDKEICLPDRAKRVIITVGRGRRRIEMSLGGGVYDDGRCGGNEIIDLFASPRMNLGLADVVEARSCPAYRRQLVKLPSERWRHPRPVATFAAISVGPFVIADRSHLFNLASQNDRRAAVRWLRQTLAAVKPCWNNFREDRKRRVVGRLYAALGMS
jgi:hypothetical protein